MICCLFCITLFAQSDSSNTNSNSGTAPAMNSSNNMDTTHQMNNMKASGSMNSNSMANGSMAMINTEEPKASLPVLETYIPADVILDIKQKVGNSDQIYDITAVKAPMDSSMMNNNAATASTTNTTATTDSTTNNQTTTTTANNSMNNMSSNASMAMPQSWDYVVRVIRNGAMVTEKLDASGNPVSQ